MSYNLVGKFVITDQGEKGKVTRNCGPYFEVLVERHSKGPSGDVSWEAIEFFYEFDMMLGAIPRPGWTICRTAEKRDAIYSQLFPALPVQETRPRA
jgi:hypothetical protein